MIDMFAEVKARVSISEAFSFYGIRINSRNKAACCFHKEDTPSLTVYPDTNSFYCFGCGVGGSVIDFAGKFHGLEPLQAAIRLNEDFNLGLTVEQLTQDQRQELERQAAQRRYSYVVAETFKEWLDDYIMYLYTAIDALEAITQSECVTARDFTLLLMRQWELGLLESGDHTVQIALYLDITGEANNCANQQIMK